MILVAIVTSGCIIKNFKCWQLGSVAWNTRRRAGKRQAWEKCAKQSEGWMLSAVPQLAGQTMEETDGMGISSGFSVFLLGHWNRGGKKCSPAFLFLPFNSHGEGQHTHLKLVPDDLLSCFRQARSACGCLQNYICFFGNGISRSLVILCPSLFALVLLCWFWLLLHYTLC